MREYALLEDRFRPTGKKYAKYRVILPTRPLEIIENGYLVFLDFRLQTVCFCADYTRYVYKICAAFLIWIYDEKPSSVICLGVCGC